MSGLVLQRYLLSAQNAVAFSVPASGNQTSTTISAIVPLGSMWTIRFRWLKGFIFPNDASGSIVIQNIDVFWQLFNSQGSQIYSVEACASIVTPPFQFNAAQYPVVYVGDPDQVVSSFDQVGSVAVSAACSCAVSVHNSDATNPHTYFVGVAGIMEFDSPGST